MLKLRYCSHYYGPNHPLVGILYLKLAKMLNIVGVGSWEEVLDHARKAEEILTVTHGRGSTLYKEQLLPLMQEANDKSLY
jgi:hypothetical protein